MRSPILNLENAIVGSAFNITPERATELANDDDVSRFCLVLSDDKRFNIRVNTSTHETTLPIATLEYVWCCAYTFFVMYQEYTHAQNSGATTIDLKSIPRVSVAIDILNWALHNMQNSGIEQWPDNTPKPGSGSNHASDIDVADELFLAAIGWIIHHEIAHVRLKHGSSHAIYSIQQEKEADLHATEWILKSSNIAQETQKRQLGIVIAIMALQFVDEPKGSNTYIQSHPSSIERLDYCLDKANAADDSLICAFASTALQFHLSQFDIQANLDGTSIRDVLSGFMVAFATKGRN